MDALPDAAYVYMVRCTGGQLYTGWTNHPAARLKAVICGPKQFIPAGAGQAA